MYCGIVKYPAAPLIDKLMRVLHHKRIDAVHDDSTKWFNICIVLNIVIRGHYKYGKRMDLAVYADSSGLQESRHLQVNGIIRSSRCFL